tara:strand:- start:419 stop:568 length:150 start_codon:yes stop_codon:yes gene_type:complete
MGLGFDDGFQPALVFWEHWCRGENDIISTEKEYPCNWCGLKEEELEDGD